MQVTVKYGHGNQITADLGNTVGEAVNASRPILKFGQNVSPSIGGVEQTDSTPLFAGCTITVNDKPCGKGS